MTWTFIACLFCVSSAQDLTQRETLARFLPQIEVSLQHVQHLNVRFQQGQTSNLQHPKQEARLSWSVVLNWDVMRILNGRNK